MEHKKRIIAIVLFALLSFAQSNAYPSFKEPVTVPVELKLLGSFKNQPLLQLDFFGSKAENQFSITITDQAGFVLYSDDVKGEIFSRQFLLNTEDLGDATLSFVITSKRSGRSVVYNVSPQAKITTQVK